MKALKYLKYETTLNAMFNISDIFKNIYNKSYEFGNVVKMWIGPKLLIFLVDPRDVEIILSSHVHIDKAPEYRYSFDFLITI